MKFKVPQFIDVEDKLFGPFTFRQFIYMIGGAGICFVAYKLLPLIIAIIVMLPVAGLALALTFYPFNGKPFINLLEYSFSYFIKSKLYIWQRIIQLLPLLIGISLISFFVMHLAHPRVARRNGFPHLLVKIPRLRI